MKHLAFLTLFLAMVAAPAVSADPVKVDGGNITFEAPEGFVKIPQEIINVKWPTNQRPKFVIGTKDATTTIAYDIKPHAIPVGQLPQVKKEFTDLFSRIIPGIAWKKNEIRELAGRKWIYFEITSTAIDTDIYNMMLVTGYKGRMLVFNFNSTREEFPKHEKALRKSLESIAFPGKAGGNGETDKED